MSSNKSRSTKKNKKRKQSRNKFREIREKKEGGGESFGYLTRNNGNNFRVKTLNNIELNCSIKNTLKHSLNISEGDLVLVELSNEKEKDRGVIVFKYSKSQEAKLAREGKLNRIEIVTNEVNLDSTYMFEGEEELNNNKKNDLSAMLDDL